MFRDKRYQEITGVFLVLAGIIIFLSLFSFAVQDYPNPENNHVRNLIGPFGSFLSHYLRIASGVSSYLLAVIFLLLGYKFIRNRCENITGTLFAYLFLLVASTSLFTLMGSRDLMFTGGYTGLYLNRLFRAFLGNAGSTLVIIMINIAGMILTGFISIAYTLDLIASRRDTLRGLVSRLGKFLARMFRKSPPRNSIDEKLHDRKDKLPWIEKKTVYLYQKTDREDNSAPQLRYLQLPLSDDNSRGNAAAGLSLIESPGENHADLLHREPGAEISGSLHLIDDLDDENIIDVPESPDCTAEILCGTRAEIGPLPAEDIQTDDVMIADDDGSDDGVPLWDLGSVPEKNRTAATADIPEVPKHAKMKEILQPVNDTPPVAGEYVIPVDFLDNSIHVDTENWKNEIKKNSELLVNTLAEFSIESRVINVNRGPVITLYEIQIAPGIKVNKIVGLADDIAMALAALRVRIVAPIPGKSAIGVEIPNRERENVTLGDVIKSREYQKQTGHLKVALGKDILGNPIPLDIRRLPHLLIAGATGSGKSVCVNTIITSLMYNYEPGYLRFILIDPKMVELQIYNGSPHLLTPVITETQSAQTALKWIIYEMDRRYRLLSDRTCRDIEKYNHIIKESGEAEEPLPYVITIIDELADLMMSSSTKDIEGYITRIAQKARAVGIHLVLATQRPSVDVITGVIKANFPARIAFQVAQKTDSRTILDQNGAEKLLGRGDMLYQSPMCSFPVRIQGSYVSEDEIVKIVNYLRTICRTDYIDIESYVQEEEELSLDSEESDELFNEALKIIEETRKASASYLQRRLSIGYNRAARIIEMMEEKGYIGPQHGSRAREIYI